ncbi:MAG: hypothetical protein II752_00905 [Muribaculaceae bacterium]|nr:hypothetical protein [Muribaculaceae bacterium]
MNDAILSEFSSNTNGIVEEIEKNDYYKTEDIKTEKFSGGNYSISPYDYFCHEQVPDASIIPIFANTERIKKYLPGLNFSDEINTKKTLKSFLLKTELGMGFVYIIRQVGLPVGMILVHSPKYNKLVLNLRVWSVDFFVFEAAEHIGLMYNALIRVLRQLKNMGASRVYALVDGENIECINLIGNGMFKQVDNTNFQNTSGGSKPLVYCMNLEKIRFEIH